MYICASGYLAIGDCYSYEVGNEGATLLGQLFGSGGSDRNLGRIVISLDFHRPYEPSTSDRSGIIRINLTTATDGLPTQTLNPGENNSRVGSSFRVLAHELYHVSFWDADLARNENAAVRSANRAVAQISAIQGRPERAGVRTCYYPVDCAPRSPSQARSKVEPGTAILD